MLDQEFSSEEALDKAYADHLDSLKVGGFLTKESETALMSAWAEAVLDFREKKSQPRWLDDL